MPYAWVTPATIEPGTVTITITVPVDLTLFTSLIGAVLALTEPDNWEQTGEATPEECAAAFLQTLDDLIEA